MAIADEIKAARQERMLTQAQLGEMIGVLGQQVSRWETGDVAVSERRVRMVARALGYPVERFMPELAEREATLRELEQARPEPARPARPAGRDGLPDELADRLVRLEARLDQLEGTMNAVLQGLVRTTV